MGLINVKIELQNPIHGMLAAIEVNTMVDTSARHLCVRRHIAIQLGLNAIQQREVTTADGARHLCDYVGPIQVTFRKRSCSVGALVLGDEVLLGTVPMEDLDLVISPSRQTVEVNPKAPNIPSSVAKSRLRRGLISLWGTQPLAD
jgi:clan AA aspartic protease